ncbi:MAG TPA: division/cell wall cluster transcriptional repressor MraZ [Candidatus Paceibacterota bacterium]
MFIGEHRHALDDKKRLTLPVRLRRSVGKSVVVTRGLDGCLFLYTSKDWQGISAKLGSLGMGQADTRGFARFMLASAAELDVDAAGRILVPEHLREFAAVRDAVVVAGVANRLEIWDEKRWKSYASRVSRGADEMAEKLGQIGAI